MMNSTEDRSQPTTQQNSSASSIVCDISPVRALLEKNPWDMSLDELNAFVLALKRTQEPRNLKAALAPTKPRNTNLTSKYGI